jgi:hypothetical protein
VTACAFCPNTANITGEHLWSAWIGNILPTKRYRYQREEGNETVEWFSAKINQKTNVVCKDCNSTWMSDLKGSAKAAFTPIIRDGRPTTFQSEDITLLASWAFKHAVIANHSLLEGEPMYTIAERERFRLSLMVPERVRVWITAFQGRSRFSGKFHSRYIRSINEPPPLNNLEFFAFTYVAGHLGFQVFSGRWKSLSNRGRRIGLPEQADYWNPACERIWPYDGRGIEWPKKYLGEQTIQAFVDRWEGKLNVTLTSIPYLTPKS